jgi:hypothetical protein
MKQLLTMAGIAVVLSSASQATQISDSTVVTNSSPFGFAPSRTLAAVCPHGTVALGGGAATVAGGGALPVLASSQPILGTVEGWVAHANDEEPEEAGGWRLVVTAICGNLDGLSRDTFEMSSFGLRKAAIAGCPVDEVAVSGGANGFDAESAVLQRSIPVNPNTWGGTVRATGNADFTLRVTALCAPADDDISVFSLSSTTNAAATKELSIVCPEGASVLSGGAEAVDEEDLRAALTASGPLFDDGKIIGWRAEADARQASPPAWRLDIAVTCPEATGAPLAIAALAMSWRKRARDVRKID